MVKAPPQTPTPNNNSNTYIIKLNNWKYHEFDCNQINTIRRTITIGTYIGIGVDNNVYTSNDLKKWINMDSLNGYKYKQIIQIIPKIPLWFCINKQNNLLYTNDISALQWIPMNNDIKIIRSCSTRRTRQSPMR